MTTKQSPIILLLLAVLAAGLYFLVPSGARQPAPEIDDIASSPPTPSTTGNQAAAQKPRRALRVRRLTPVTDDIRTEWDKMRNRFTEQATDADETGEVEDLLALTPDEIETTLDANGRPADYLMAAAELAGNVEYLLEAGRLYPDNPQVQLAMLQHLLFSPDGPGPDVEKWLRAFQDSSPDNPLGAWLAASYALKQNRTADAIVLMQQPRSGVYDDYIRDRSADRMAFLQAAGKSELVAATSIFGVGLPHLSEIRAVSRALVAASESQRSAGDTGAAMATAEAAATMGRQILDGAPPFLITQLVGVAMGTAGIEQQLLLTPPGDPAITALDDRLIELQKQRDAIRLKVSTAQDVTQMTADQVIDYVHQTLQLDEGSALPEK